MRQIPKWLLQDMLEDEYYARCAREDDGCDGRITLEHSMIHAGRQVNERWAIIPLCTYHHSVDEHQDGDGLDKEMNEWIALSRATEADLLRMSKAIYYPRRLAYLQDKYGTYDPEQRGWNRKPDNSGYYDTKGGDKSVDNGGESCENTSENWVISSGWGGDEKREVQSIGQIIHKIRKDFPQLSPRSATRQLAENGSKHTPIRILLE